MAKITWQGMPQLKRKLESNMNMAAVKKLIKYHGAGMDRRAKTYVPVGETGNLKGSIMLQIVDNGLAAEISAGMHYAPYVEYGTRFMSAQPYIRPAFNEQKALLLSDLLLLTR